MRYAHQTAGSKARVPHLCPHGLPCIAGKHTTGFNVNGACDRCTKSARTKNPVAPALRKGAMRPIGWKLPASLEVFRDAIGNTGGNRIEDLLTRELDIRINMPVTVLAIAVDSQVALLETLNENGALMSVHKRTITVGSARGAVESVITEYVP